MAQPGGNNWLIDASGAVNSFRVASSLATSCAYCFTLSPHACTSAAPKVTIGHLLNSAKNKAFALTVAHCKAQSCGPIEFG